MTSRFVADLLAAKMLVNIVRGKLTTPLPELHVTPNGAAFELYQSKQARKTIVFVYGLLLQGERDPRVIRFARAMASTGVRVVVPVLNGMKSFLLEPADRDALTDIIEHVSQNENPTAIFAASAGACLALCAAANSTRCGRANPIMLISPVYDLNTALTALHDPSPPMEESISAWHGYIWKQCAIAYRNRKIIGLPDETRLQLEDILRRYDNGLTSDEIKVFYQTCLLPLKLHEHQDAPNESEALQALTPRGKLNQIHSRVIIIHSAHDPIVPPEHARQMMDELQQRGKSCEQQLLITPVLSHDLLQRTTRLRDMFHFTHLLGELFV